MAAVGTPAYASSFTSQFGKGSDPYYAYGSANGVYYNQAGDPIPSNLISNQGVLGSETAKTTAAAAPVDTSGYDQAIGNTQAAIDRLPTALASNNSAIDASYGDTINGLTLGKNQADAQYGEDKTASGKDYVTTKNTIMSNAGSTLNGVRRLLGSRGAGGSSAATIVAPNAVGRQSTLQLNDAAGTFGTNNRTLDQNYGNYNIGYGNSVAQAGEQRDQKKQAAEQTNDTTQAQLLQSIATLLGQRASAVGGNPVTAAQPSIDAANAVLDHAANYTVSPIAVNTAAYQAPNLSTYTTQPNATIVANATGGGTDYISPYLAALLGKKSLTVAQ